MTNNELEKGYTKEHGIFKLHAHIVLACKYRKQMLRVEGGLDQKIWDIINDIAEMEGFKIVGGGSDYDHIHLLISFNPEHSIVSLIKWIKQISTFRIWQDEESKIKLKQFFGGERTFWADGYCVCSVGETNFTAIENYIANSIHL